MTYSLCPPDCHQTPGLTLPFPDSALNWLALSTPDQIRIESWLSSHLDNLTIAADDAVLLHVGVGNSDFAKRFCPQVRAVHGLTVGLRERAVAYRMGIPNYQTYRINKYHPQLLSWLDWVPYSFIVDNNLASYACCQKHFNSLLTNYALMLREDGAILTDRAGLAHAPGDPNWNLVDEIEPLAAGFGLTATWETESILALRKAVSDDN